jgi:phosphodiesterase/alkaline phosphatase D-like protein
MRRAPLVFAILSLLGPAVLAGDFRASIPPGLERAWIGPEFWTNPLQDWRIADGRIECTVAAPNRSVHLLTREVAAPGDLRMKVRLGFPGLADARAKAGTSKEPGWAGFRIGARGRFFDYRDTAVRGDGWHVGLTEDGVLFVEHPESDYRREGSVVLGAKPDEGIEIRVEVTTDEADGHLSLTLSAVGPASAPRPESLTLEDAFIEPGDLVGGIALVSSFPASEGRSRPGAWFSDWTVSGSKVVAHEDRAFGPILFSMYTLDRDLLKMTAQMPPLSDKDGRSVRLEIREPAESGEEKWKEVASAPIDPLARTATLRVEGWDTARDVTYRLVHESVGPDGALVAHHRDGTVRKDPRDAEEFVVAVFTGNHDLGFPHGDLVSAVAAHDPDFLFFSGDQIYEGVGGFGHTRSPLEIATLDYLRKWYLFGWAFGDLLRNRPAVAIPDDHDVYHGNLWGAGGKAVDPGGSGADQQDSGGYRMPPEWVRMVERTQTSHLPDPFDPRPVEQGIGVYFCEIVYGGLGFAVVEDRKFKSAPKPLLPDAKVWNGWPQNPGFDAKKSADVPGAVLLGDRQLAFLRAWARDWSGGAWMKVVLSQTLFSNVATIPEDATSGSAIPRLPIPETGAYPEGQKIAADMDSNGWPPSGRNRALREMRRAFALHLAGDQHLGSTIRYGIDDWDDAGYALCVPSVSNYWPRRWYPDPGVAKGREPGAPLYTGRFEDGFGNKMTVHAVANPSRSGREPAEIYDRSSGYGIVRFRRAGRAVTIECWPRGVDPSSAGAKPFPGWPIRIRQLDNYAREPYGTLRPIVVEGLIDPVVEVISEPGGETLYTLRIEGTEFRPPVFGPGLHRVRVGDPDADRWTTVGGLEPLTGDEAAEAEPIRLRF